MSQTGEKRVERRQSVTLSGRLRSRIWVLRRLSVMMMKDPREGVDRIRNKIEVRRNAASSSTQRLHPHPAWDQELHCLLEAKWPCDACNAFADVWFDTVALLGERTPSNGHDFDADPALARAVLSAVRHSRPERVIETGVARGVTSRFILEGLAMNRKGHLWSIDLPPLSGRWEEETGVAVPEQLRSRWTYMRGSSRRLLPSLCRARSPIDLCLFDSLHTESNVRFELEFGWENLKRGGIILVDDVDDNSAFMSVARSLENASSFLGGHERKHGLFGFLLKHALA